MIQTLPDLTAYQLEKCINKAVENANKQKLSASDNSILSIRNSLQKQLGVFASELLNCLAFDKVVPPNLVSTRPEVNLQRSGPASGPKNSFSSFIKMATFTLPRPIIHIVKPNDVLWTICNNKGYKNLSVDEVCLWNGISKTSTIFPGNQLWLYDRTNPIISEIIRVYGVNADMHTLIDPGKLNPFFTNTNFIKNTYYFNVKIGAPHKDVSAIVYLDLSVTVYSCAALEISYFSVSITNSSLDLVVLINPTTYQMLMEGSRFQNLRLKSEENIDNTSLKKSWCDNTGVYVTGIVLTAEDVYNNFYHNHKTYTTTKGVVKNIYKPNGAVRSARAGQFANISTTVKIAGTAGSALMSAQAGTKIYNGNANIFDYSDFSVGTAGVASGFAELGGYSIPYVGEFVALYSWGRLWFDLGAKYGPSKWYGDDNNSWFK